jgi:hypothetical protein
MCQRTRLIAQGPFSRCVEIIWCIIVGNGLPSQPTSSSSYVQVPERNAMKMPEASILCSVSSVH